LSQVNTHNTSGFPASSAGQALLEFIPMKIGAGMTKLKTSNLNFLKLKNLLEM